MYASEPKASVFPCAQLGCFGARRVYNVLEGMTPPVGGGRCAVLALGHWGSDRRSAARARRQRVAQVGLRYRRRRVGRCRPPRRLAALVARRPGPTRSLHQRRQIGPAPSIAVRARSDAADRPVRRAQHPWTGPARAAASRAPTTCLHAPVDGAPIHRGAQPSRRRRRRTLAARRPAPRPSGTAAAPPLRTRCPRPPHAAVGPRAGPARRDAPVRRGRGGGR